MLAETAFLVTALIIAAVAGAIGYYVFRPAWKRVARACDHVDAMSTLSEQERKTAESELEPELTEHLREH